MFAGKTTELIRRAHAAGTADALVLAPARDTRSGPACIRTHTGVMLPARTLADAAEIDALPATLRFIAIDEAHFFGHALIAPVQRLLAHGCDVTIAGLERDHRGEPFEPFPALLCEADEVIKLSSPCARCGAPALHSQRMIASDERIVVGGAEAYQPRCRTCFGKP